ncbi:MAG: class I SAM-dependent methyltransferase [Chloroflexota bacterium]
MNKPRVKTDLTDVPETMLWTLHNRASEAMRADGIINDPEAVRIYQSIDYDYERSFRKADPSHAIRSLMFDKEVQAFLEKHSDGSIVNLGEGLETQRFRVVGEQSQWFSIDLPEAMAVRERFIQPDVQHHHIPLSVLDTTWFDAIPQDKPVFITAQGLFMYFPEAEVRRLFQQMAARFPGAWLMFDCIPTWFSKRTMRGLALTPHYTTPKMPWGINKPNIEATLRSWLPKLAQFEDVTLLNVPRGVGRLIFPIMMRLPIVKNMSPSVNLIRFEE